jgi:hypothetical protein
MKRRDARQVKCRPEEVLAGWSKRRKEPGNAKHLLKVTADRTVPGATPRTVATAECTAVTGATHCLQAVTEHTVTVTGVPPHLQSTAECTLIGIECLLRSTLGMMQNREGHYAAEIDQPRFTA